LLKQLLGLRPKHFDGLAELQELPFGLAYQLHEDVALPPALAAKAPHDFFQFLLQPVGLGPQCDDPAAGSLGDTFDALQGFFCALYSVVASVTRWLPCSQGKVSTTRWAGLTRPSSIAAAA